MHKIRIGHGYDVHRLVENRKLILGGVEIPFERGLLGHSDADVLLHAIMDALLGAAALGDIGHLFPDQDDAFLNADSLVLLQKVQEVLTQNGWKLGNLDATVIAQAPKMAPHIAAMRENIAACLQTDVRNVSIKATTEEHLGFTGSGEGISAHAVCLLEQGKYNRIVGMKGEKLVDYPVDEALEMTKTLDPVLLDVCNTISI